MTALDQLGAELVAARAAGIPWKILEARYGHDRSKLHLLWRLAGGRPRPGDRRAGGG